MGLLWTSDQPVAEAATYPTHNKHKMNIHTLKGFEPVIAAVEWLQNYALDRTATGIGSSK